MKTLVRWLVAFAAIPGALIAQSIVGTWQGTLKAGSQELRIVLKVATTDNDTLKAMFYSIDQGGASFPASSLAMQASVVKMSIPGIPGTYEGKVEGDGKTITGTWSQGPKPLPLTLTRATAETAWTIPEQQRPKALPADSNPAFEVATIKPSAPGQPGFGIGVRGRRLSTINTTVVDLITFAYQVQVKQVLGVPASLESEKYDVSAEFEQGGVPNLPQLQVMLQKLLAERFQLAFHRDKKELSVYALTVAKGGQKLTPSGRDPNGLPGVGFRGLGKLFASNATMADFAGVMQGTALDRPIVDQTGIQGRYDFSLNWTPDEFQFARLRNAGPLPPASANSEEAPDLFTAIQQQLGLKLEVTKALADVIAIDRVQKPSEN